jgi:hypothetical protein
VQEWVQGNVQRAELVPKSVESAGVIQKIVQYAGLVPKKAVLSAGVGSRKRATCRTCSQESWKVQVKKSCKCRTRSKKLCKVREWAQENVHYAGLIPNSCVKCGSGFKKTCNVQNLFLRIVESAGSVQVPALNA